MFTWGISKSPTNTIERPGRTSTDRDPFFRSHRWQANRRVRNIEEIKSVPCTPVLHLFVEVSTETILRKCRDRMLLLADADLAQELDGMSAHYPNPTASIDRFTARNQAKCRQPGVYAVQARSPLMESAPSRDDRDIKCHLAETIRAPQVH